MRTFLQQAATHIFKQHELLALQNVKVVLPSRRAVLFFKKELAQLSEIPFFAPEIVSIDDFIKNNSIYSLLDPIELLIEAYEIWLKIEPGQSFEKFLSWASIMLGDFDLIDMSLLDQPEHLFRYMSASEAIKRWNLEIEEEDFTKSFTDYLSFFDKMGQCYFMLREKLGEKSLGFTGMIYRDVAENLQRWIEKEQTYYFVGLNALTKAEERITKGLQKAGLARFIWDTDQYYMSGEYRASSKLLKYKYDYGPEWNFESDLLSTHTKEINVFPLGSKVMEAKLVVDLLNKSQSDSQALVVLDDAMFPALYLHLPSLNKHYNISAGMNFRSTRLYGFLLDFLNFIHFNERRVEANSLKTFLAVSKEILENEVGEERLRQIWNQVLESQRIFYSKKELKDWFKASRLFLNVLSIKEINDVVDVLNELIYAFIQRFPEEKTFGYSFIEKTEKIKHLISEKPYVSYDSILQLIKEEIKSFNIPFESELEVSVQVMSMLETRGLDFKEVTFLSFLEGSLPSTKKQSSFFPLDALVAFQLPVYYDQDSIMSYHFFRLIQRAEKVNLIYSLDSGGVGKSEPSRFLYQIEEDLAKKNKNLSINYFEFNQFLDSKELGQPNIEIQKTPEILEKISYFLTHKGLSPTSINEYFNSPITFYWKYIAKIREREEEDTDIGANDLGNIIHHVLEEMDKPYWEGRNIITVDILKKQKQAAIINAEDYIRDNMGSFDFENGLNLVLKTVILELLGKYYDKRIEYFKNPFKIIELEKEYEKIVEVNDVQVKIRGKVDKIEQHGSVFHLIDYKTGRVEDKEVGVGKSTLEEKLRGKESDKFRQLCIYLYLIDNIFGENAILEPKFYSFRSLDSDLKLKLNKYKIEEIPDLVFAMIKEMVNELLDITIPLTQRHDRRVNTYSDFYNLLN